MLKIKRIDKIRSMFFDEGCSVTDIARQLQVSTHSVYKYIRMNDFSNLDKKRKSVLDTFLPYEDFILGLMEEDRNAHRKQRYTGRRIFDCMKLNYPDFLFSYTSLMQFIRKVKYKVYKKKQYIPLKHLPGVAQVDFADFYYYKGDERIMGHMLVVTFPYSNASYCQLFNGKAAECLLQGLKNIFAHLGGVPYELVFDNDGAIVKVNYDTDTIRVPTELFLRFKNHYAFRSYFCNFHSPNEKANVETAISFIRKSLLVPTPTIDDLDSFNVELLCLCDKINNRKRKGFVNSFVNEMFEIDKKAFIPLPIIDFTVETTRPRVCDLMGSVSIGGKHQYYLSPKFAGIKIITKTTYKEVIFYDEFNREITRMDRLCSPDGVKCVNWGEYLLALSRKVNALSHCDIISHFPESLTEFLLDNEKSVQRDYLRVMYDVYLVSDFETAVIFATSAAENCVTDYEELVRLAKL